MDPVKCKSPDSGCGREKDTVVRTVHIALKRFRASLNNTSQFFQPACGIHSIILRPTASRIGCRKKKNFPIELTRWWQRSLPYWPEASWNTKGTGDLLQIRQASKVMWTDSKNLSRLARNVLLLRPTRAFMRSKVNSREIWTAIRRPRRFRMEAKLFHEIKGIFRRQGWIVRENYWLKYLEPDLYSGLIFILKKLSASS